MQEVRKNLAWDSVKGAGLEAPFAFKSARRRKKCQNPFFSGIFQVVSHTSEAPPCSTDRPHKVQTQETLRRMEAMAPFSSRET